MESGAHRQQEQPQPRGPRESLSRATDIARRFGENSAADLAESLLDASFRSGTVVVVGEIKRGKSSLVNALVGHENLLPVDVLTSTSAPIRVSVNAPEEGSAPAAPVAQLVRGHKREPVEQRDLARYVTIDGIAGSRSGSDEDELVTAATVEVEYPQLTGVTIVDTPGVGGLDEHAVKASFNEAHRAGVLLMVCDASTPITKPEMDILAQARKEVGGVIVAVTKTDKNIRRWKSIVEDDRRLIREHLGADIPVIGVSSLRAADAVKLVANNPAKAAEIEHRSGIVELRQQLEGMLADPEALGMRSALESIATTLSGIQAQISRDIEIHTEPAEGVEKLEAEQQELESLKEHAAEWEQLLSRDIQLMRNRITDELDAEIEQLRNEWTQRINSEGMRVLRSKPQVFTSQIEGELTDLIRRTLDAQLHGLQQRAEQLFPEQPDLVHSVIGAALEAISPEEVKGSEVEKKTKDLLNPQMVTMGVIGAGMLSVVIPFAPIAGAVWVGINMGFGAMRNGKNHLVQWLREISQTTRMSTARMLDTMISAARTEMVLRYRAYLRQRQKDVQAHIKDAREAARESETVRKEKVARLSRNQRIVAATLEELKNHIAAV